MVHPVHDIDQLQFLGREHAAGLVPDVPTVITSGVIDMKLKTINGTVAVLIFFGMMLSASAQHDGQGKQDDKQGQSDRSHGKPDQGTPQQQKQQQPQRAQQPQQQQQPQRAQQPQQQQQQPQRVQQPQQQQ